MRKLLMFGILALLASTGAQAQEKPKALKLQLGHYGFEPVFKPTLADMTAQPYKGESLDPLARKKITIFIGAKWSEGGAEMQFGITPKIKHDLIHFEARY